jgi:hypothetical protein
MRLPLAAALLVASTFFACSSSSPAGSGPTSTPDASVVDSSAGDDSSSDANESTSPDAALACSSPIADAGFDSLSTLPLATWCGETVGNLFEQSCGSLVRVVGIIGVDCGTTFYFDAGSGALVATIDSCGLPGQDETECTATSSSFVPPATCAGTSQLLCVDAGPDGGSASDAGEDAATDAGNDP